MRKIFCRKLVIVVFIFMILVSTVGYYALSAVTTDALRATAKLKINQIEQLLVSNEREIDTLKATLREDYLSRAEAVAYIVEQNPEIVFDNNEITNVAELMQIDEIHIFDAQGIIIAGTVDEYIGVGVNDGEQIGYFKQLLEDPSLKLVQDITPATADGIMKQYTGVTRVGEPGIIQIGMEPERMIETLRRTELSYVLSNIVISAEEEILVIDLQSGTVIGSTNDVYVGENSTVLGYHPQVLAERMMADGYSATKENGSFIVTKDFDDVSILIINEEYRSALNMNLIILVAFLLIVSISMIIVINHLLEKHVIHGIDDMLLNLKKITDGNLDTVIMVNENPEFRELSNQINTMVENLLESTVKFSQVIESINIDMAIYEYNNDMQTVRVTQRLSSILKLTHEETQSLFSDKTLFKAKLEELRINQYSGLEDLIYYIPGPDERYIKISDFSDDRVTIGMVADVTEDIMRRNAIMEERDIDVLTNIYNRRAFMRKAEARFNEEVEGKVCCIFTMDMDNLKLVNDTYGHVVGDQYIQTGANILIESNQCEGDCLIARLGGDEFAVYWQGYESKDEILVQVKKIEDAMMKAVVPLASGAGYPVRFSSGYAFRTEDTADIKSLLRLADRAMYEAKRLGSDEAMQFVAGMGDKI